MDSPHSWKDEAKAVIKDIEALVQTINVSEKLISNKHRIYLNIVTNENKPYCIELSPSGFRIVGNAFDVIDIESDQYYDTPYSLLSQISNSYTYTFANALISKLQNISDAQ